MKFHGIDCQGKILVQRLTSAQRGSTIPSIGRIIYDTDLNKLYYGDGVGWNEFGGSETLPSPSELEYRKISATTDEGGLLTKTQSGVGTTTGIYYISNFTAGIGFLYEKARGIYIRCRANQVGTFSEYSRIICTYPDGSTKKLLETFNENTTPQEGTGIDIIVFLPINKNQSNFTITLTCSAAAGNTQYEIIGCLHITDSDYEINMLTGSVAYFGGSSGAIPSGWLLCDGSAINRITYTKLFSIIEDKYGIGDGINTFNLPDLRGRFILGQNNFELIITRVPPNVLLGDVGGEYQHALTTNEMPTHTHELDKVARWPGGDTLGKTTGLGRYVGPTGGGLPHNTTPPYMVFNCIIKT